MSKKICIASIVISVISIALAAFCLCRVMSCGKDASSGGTAQYVMYVGTNDKDTYQPEHTKDEAFDIVDRICLKYFEGYTIQEATGSWTDEKGEPTHEYTIVCYFDDTDKETVYKAADEIIKELNQNTVLIESDTISIEYYSGN